MLHRDCIGMCPRRARASISGCLRARFGSAIEQRPASLEGPVTPVEVVVVAAQIEARLNPRSSSFRLVDEGAPLHSQPAVTTLVM